MAEPKKKLTRTRSGNRRSQQHLASVQPTKCSNCNEEVKGHTVCSNCGHYKGKKIYEVK